MAHKRKRGCTIEVEPGAREILLEIIEMSTGSRTGMSMKRAFTQVVTEHKRLCTLQARYQTQEASSPGLLILGGTTIPDELKSLPSLLTIDVRVK
jgi:hypothetical protein